MTDKAAKAMAKAKGNNTQRNASQSKLADV